jgi:ABC-type Fe3+ transport system permease subunit
MRRRNWVSLIVAGVGIALAITLFSPLASSSPDGLERVAEDKEFIEQAREPGYEIIPDYTFPGIENEALATIISGIVGVLIVAAIGLAVGYGMRALARSRADASLTSGERSAETGSP